MKVGGVGVSVEKGKCPGPMPGALLTVLRLLTQVELANGERYRSETANGISIRQTFEGCISEAE